VLTAAHLVAFARLFHKQHTVETLIDDEPESGMEHNIHLVHLTRSTRTESPETLKGLKPGQSPPTQPPYVKQFGGSGLGHFVASPPASVPEQRMQSKPLVESPDHNSQVFPVNQRSSGSGAKSPTSGKEKARSREDVMLGEPVGLFASTEGAMRK
jgi:hypothetical protein